MFAQMLAFAGVSALVIVTPGPDTALTVRNTLLRGRRAGVLTAGGVAAGQATGTQRFIGGGYEVEGRFTRWDRVFVTTQRRGRRCDQS